MRRRVATSARMATGSLGFNPDDEEDYNYSLLNLRFYRRLSIVLPLAADTPMDWISPLLQFGGVGVCLIWFMFRSEPRLRAIEAAIDRVSRALIVLSIAIGSALEALQWYSAKAIKTQAEPIGKELDEAATKREQ